VGQVYLPFIRSIAVNRAQTKHSARNRRVASSNLAREAKVCALSISEIKVPRFASRKISAGWGVNSLSAGPSLVSVGAATFQPTITSG
jgi:hypothetical protein